MKRLLIFIYGLLCDFVFLVTFLYAVGFIGNFGVPKSIDSPPAAPLVTALLTNLALVAVFGIQHTGMKEEALELLERVFNRGWGKRDWIDRDPDYDFLREDPRFKLLLAKIK